MQLYNKNNIYIFIIMDKITSLIDTNATPSPSSDYTPSLTNTTSDTSIWSSIKNIGITNWVIIFFILSLLGFNIFYYLAVGTQDITNFFKPIFEKILVIFGLTAKTVVDVTAESSRTVVNTGADVFDKTTRAIQDTVDKPFEQAQMKQQITPSTASTSISNDKFQQPPLDVMQANTLNKALNTSATGSSSSNQDYEADESSSTIQRGGASSKAGWCYIGEDRGFRTCAQVGVNDNCMSGDIFPSQEICINPKLRP